MRRLSNEEIVELYNAGELSLREIGERAGLSGEMVLQIAKKAGAPESMANYPCTPHICALYLYLKQIRDNPPRFAILREA
jgi:hypothetical protein